MVSELVSRLEIGDCRAILPTLGEQTFQCCVTSPPYWGLRDYGHANQIGHESTPEEYAAELVGVFREVRRVLRDDGTCWLNLGDSYCGAPGGFQGKHGQRASRTFTARIDMVKRDSGLKPKDLVGIPWRVAFALQADGWYLRSDIIWSKPNPMPESVTDRPTKAHEYVFLLSKSERYFYDATAIAEPVATTTAADARRLVPRARDFETAAGSFGEGTSAARRNAGNAFGTGDSRNSRDVWTLPGEPYAEAHFATMPTALASRCIQAGSSLGSAVLDPFMGSGTVGQVAEELGRSWFGCELNADYGNLTARRTAQTGLRFRAGQP